MQQTAFNMCGFIQPVNMLKGSDPDAFNDRQFFICPEEVEYTYPDLIIPMDPTVAKLEDIFRMIKDSHKSKCFYKFTDRAQDVFIKAHDNLCERKVAISDDEDRRGILSKAKGQLARLAMVIHSLEQAVSITDVADVVWSSEIEDSSVERAIIIMEYFIEQKFALMQPEVKIPLAVAAT